MIDFTMPEEIEMLRQTVRAFVTSKLQPLEAEVEQKGYIPPEKLAALKIETRALGLYAMNMPEDVGGGGLSTVAMSVVEEELGKTSDALIRRSVGQVYEMLLACKGPQRDTYLLPTVRGEKICCMAITEPGAGSDAASIALTARLDGDHYVLNGTKHFISDGTLCDYAIVMALTDREKRARGGITLFLVDKQTPGFTATRVQPMMGHRGYDHSELSFQDCRVPAANILGELGGGFKLIMSTVNRIRLLHIGARSVGMATRLLEMCTAHARDRVQFGKPIGEYQMVQQMLADMAIKIYATRMMVLNAAWEIDAGVDPRDKVSMIKVYAAEMLGDVADKAVQIHGGSGFCRDLPIERIYRDCRVLRIYDGTSEIHRMLIARSLLKNGVNA